MHQAASRWARTGAAALWLLLAAPLPAAMADDDTLASTTVSFPAEKASYERLSALADVKVGNIAPPESAAAAPRLHVIDTVDDQPAIRVDDDVDDATPFLIDDAGRAGIGTADPDVDARLDVGGPAAVNQDVELGVHVDSDGTVTKDPEAHGDLVCTGCVDGADVDPAQVLLRVQQPCPPGQAMNTIYENGSVLCIPIQVRQPPSG